jgi:predicted transcriptional regulator
MELTNIKELMCNFYDGIGSMINNMSESEISDLCASATTMNLDPEISELYKNTIGIDYNNLSESEKNYLLNVKSDEVKDCYKNYSSSINFDDEKLREAMEKLGIINGGEDILRQFVEA